MLTRLLFFVAPMVLGLVTAADEDPLDKSIQEYQAKIFQLEQSIREVKANTAALDHDLSTREKSYQNCAQSLAESYARLGEAGVDEYDQLLGAIGDNVDRVFPVYKDPLTRMTCAHETYIASLPGSQLSASSVYNLYSGPTHSYLHYKQNKPWEREAWIPKKSDKTPWIQADLGMEKEIFALGYAGAGDRNAQVKLFNISYSSDGKNWVYMDKTFKGLQKESSLENINKLSEDSLMSEIIIHEFKPMIRARYVKLHPVKEHWMNAVRWELYGPKCMDNGEIGYIRSREGNGLWGPNRHKHSARFSLLHGSLAWTGSRNKMPDYNNYIQMDMVKITSINAIATQGKKEAPEWITAFSLKYRDEATKKWIDYKKGYVFNGNFDENTAVVHPLEPAIDARYIRLFAKSWNNWPSLRWELYGPSRSDFPERLCLW